MRHAILFLLSLTALPLTVTSVRVARAALAVERYRRLNGGALPERLDALVPRLLSAVPVDPYSGRLLHYRRLSTGYEVYGVSYDRVDDGGDRLKDLPVIRVER